jgi:hydrogenase nickel incorporation protein HypB
MCETCGCSLPHNEDHTTADGRKVISVMEDLLSENNHQAAHNREYLETHGVLAINLMSSPGSGKTRLLEATIETLRDEFGIGVIVGDLETENDAQRIRHKGVPAVQITTGSACHLDARMLHKALHELPLDGLDILFIENVGNLVCPASFDLGQHKNVVLLSVPEGDDKPAKYPVMFRSADLMLITKADLLPHMDDFRPERAIQALRNLASQVPALTLSAVSGQELAAWLDWLRAQLAHRPRPSPAPLPHHHG